MLAKKVGNLRSRFVVLNTSNYFDVYMGAGLDPISWTRSKGGYDVPNARAEQDPAEFDEEFPGQAVRLVLEDGERHCQVEARWLAE